MSAIRLEQDGPVATLVLDNPESRNALTGAMIEQLSEHLDVLQDWDEGLGLILRGQGSLAFCAGADLSYVRSHRHDPETGERMCRHMQELTQRLRALPLVSVAAIEGGAWGGGAELTTCTDFRVIAADARVHFVHARLGLSPGWGGGTRLVGLVGRRRALHLLAGSQPANAQQALAWGLVDEVCSPGSAERSARRLLQPYLELKPDSVRAAKILIGAADELPVREALLRERRLFTELWSPASAPTT
jgi:ethylmalonyl-CoA/methylmalonyl-CoA decarboxylase